MESKQNMIPASAASVHGPLTVALCLAEGLNVDRSVVGDGLQNVVPGVPQLVDRGDLHLGPQLANLTRENVGSVVQLANLNDAPIRHR